MKEIYFLTLVTLGISLSVQVGVDNNRTGCNRTVDAGDVLTNPAISIINKGLPYNCWFLVKPRTSVQNKDAATVIVLKFQRFQWGQLINATTCSGGYLQIYDGTTALHDSGNPGFFCGEIERSRLFISESNLLKLHFISSSYDDRFQFMVYTRQEQQQQLVERYGHHPPLYPHRRGQPVTPGSLSCDRDFVDCRLQTCYVQSPNFPGVYPRNQRCLYHVSTRQPFIKLFTEDGEFSVDGQRCDNYIMCPMRPIAGGSCPYDYIRVYDGNSEFSPVIGTFCGIGRFPFSIVGTGTDLLLEFVSSSAGPLLNTGFHFNVDSWPGQVGNVLNQHMLHQPIEKSITSNGTKLNPSCSYVLTSSTLEGSGDSEGLFLSPMHWYPPNTICNYLIIGKSEQIVRVYFPTFRIGKPDAPIQAPTRDCSETLTIYDGEEANPAKIIKAFCDTFSKPAERKDFYSTGNSLLIRFVSEIGSYSGSSLNFWAHYDFFNNTLNEGRKKTTSECDVIFEPHYRRNGRWNSPYNTLLYKRPTETSHLKCRYYFQGNPRNSSRVLLTLESLYFKSTVFQCADNLMFRDFNDRLIVLDLNTAQMKETGNLTSTSSKAYLCQPPTEGANLTMPIRVLSSSPSLMSVLHINALRSASLYFKSNMPLFQGRYDFIHPVHICGSMQPNVTLDGVINFPQYFDEDEDGMPVMCAWDFSIAEQKDDHQVSTVNETVSLWFQIEVGSSLNMVQVQKRSQCRQSTGTYIEVSAPGNELPLILLCSKSNIVNANQRQETHGDDLASGKDKNIPGVLRQFSKSSASTITLPLMNSNVPLGKVVVIVKLTQLKSNHAVRISWSDTQQ